MAGILNTRFLAPEKGGGLKVDGFKMRKHFVFPNLDPALLLDLLEGATLRVPDHIRPVVQVLCEDDPFGHLCMICDRGRGSLVNFCMFVQPSQVFDDKAGETGVVFSK